MGRLFQPGEDPRRGKGGRRPGAGRKRNVDKAAEARAEVLVDQYLRKHIHRVLDASLKAALGVKRRKHHPKTGEVYYEIEYDTSNQRHWIDKFKSDAPRDVNVRDKTYEDLLEEVLGDKK